jgi:hypothetical protein
VPKIHWDIQQLTPEWDAIRSGKLTASIASTLITPTGKPSTRYKGEIARIIAEAAGWQEPGSIPQTYWMERGVEVEPQARGWYTIESGKLTKECGFIDDDTGLFGFSPDGLVQDDDEHNGYYALELKCPKPSTHVQWMLDGGVPGQHLAQCHFGMIILDAHKGCFMSYHPEAEALISYISRNEYTQVFESQMVVFLDEFNSSFQKVIGETYFEFTVNRSTT